MAARVALAVLAVGSAGCKSFEEESAEYRELYYAGSFAEAEAAIDRRIAEENDLEGGVALSGGALPPGVDAAKGDTCVLLLDRAMAAVGRGDVGTAVDLLRQSRDQLDDNFGLGFTDIAKSIFVDAASTDYGGHDYEHVMVRAMLAMLDLIEGGDDAYAYAVQVGTRQEEILGSDFGKEVEYNPREEYQRVAIGAYLEGIIREGERETDDANLAFARAKQYSGEIGIVEAAMERTAGGAWAGADEGVLHVFYLAGRGPHLTETTDLATTVAVNVAATLLSLAAVQDVSALGNLAQDAVPIPTPVVLDAEIEPLTVSAAGRQASSEVLLSVNDVVSQQIEANQTMRMALNLARRTVKGIGAGAAGKAVAEDSLWGGLVTGVAGHAATAGERADTRSWTTLPAEVHVARLPLPEGDATVDLGGGMEANVRITLGQDSYVLILRPDLGQPGVVLVDRHSVAAPTP